MNAKGTKMKLLENINWTYIQLHKEFLITVLNNNNNQLLLVMTLVIFNLSVIGKGNDILMACATTIFSNDSCSVRAHN